LKDRIMDLLMIPIAIILILLGISQLALGVVGSTVTAQVTGYEQKYIINNDESTRNPSRYKLDYAFSVNGKRYTGSVTRVFPGALSSFLAPCQCGGRRKGGSYRLCYNGIGYSFTCA